MQYCFSFHTLCEYIFQTGNILILNVTNKVTAKNLATTNHINLFRWAYFKYILVTQNSFLKCVSIFILIL